MASLASASSRIFEYFVVCGMGPEIRTLDGVKGYHGVDDMYMAAFLDQLPPSNHALYPPPPPQLPTCVLPAGVRIYSSGLDANDFSTYPRSYPIVLTEGDGSKIYVSCIAFRDPICEDILEAYQIPANSFADKCICFVSHSPSFQVLRDALEEIFVLCFSPAGCSKPLWDIISHVVSNVPLPTPGKNRVLFAIENCLLSVEAPPKEWLPHADISFQPLVQCLDVDKLIQLFTAVLLERRILLRSNKYTLLTLVSEAICHLIYPLRWQHVYIPIIFSSGVDYIDAPTPYMMGLHSGVDTSTVTMDGVVVVDLEYNRITTSEEIPPIPETEHNFLRGEILKLLQPNVMGIDYMKINLGSMGDHSLRAGTKSWGQEHDFQLRCNNAEENTNNLLDKLQDATGRGQNPLAIFPSHVADPEIITIADSETGGSEPGKRFCYKRFPTNARTEEQEEKRKSILAIASGASKQVPSSPSIPTTGGPKVESLSPRERAAERERMVLDIKVKLQGLWLRLLRLGATEDPLSSFEYGTILALIESDAEGIGGSGFVECIREHIHSGWQCRLTDEQFIAVKELLKTAITRANSRNDMPTIRDALEVSAEMYKKDPNNVQDYVQRHLLSLPVWEELRFWDGYFEYLMENCSNKSTNYVTLVTAQLIVMATHMAGLGLSDIDSWNMIEKIAERNNLGYKQLIKLRALLTHLQQLRIGYWGVATGKGQQLPSYGMASPRALDVSDESQQPAEASGLGRNWVQSMFSRDRSLRASSFNRANEVKVGATAGKTDLPAAQKKTQTNMRTLRGHTGAITALHCVTRKEVWDLVGDREDAGFFISGSTDCTVKIWDPSLRGSELRTTLKGHTRTIRAISSDRGKIVSGADDQSVIVWDKQTFKLLEELKGHDAPVSSVRMLSGERVLTASHDGTVKMWDVRTDTCVATVGRCQSAVLCMEYDDSTGILAAAGRDMFKLQGHTKWIRSMRMTGETIITGSDDWTARVWSLTRGTCDAVLACHAGPILCVEYSPSDKGIITGGIRCVKNLTLHSASVLSISASDHWLGIGAADNSMSLFHRPQERFGGFSNTGSKVAGWQLYRTPQRTAAMHRTSIGKESAAVVATDFFGFGMPPRVSKLYQDPCPCKENVNCTVVFVVCYLFFSGPLYK
uniref:UDENN domain-containing protein n=1 Tax=Oryza punctata TaxID=4537 RepID=A0A0E0JKD3_ORYPU